MSHPLDGLSEADIRARSGEASFERGRSYYAGGAVHQRVRLDDGIEARVAGTYTYRVTVHGAPGRLAATCTCPYDRGGDCKHIVATLLAWLREPESFRAPIDLRAALAARSKADLVDILTDICTIYPNMVDEIGLLQKSVASDPLAAVAKLFAAMEPAGDISTDEAEGRMEIIARRADRLAQQGQGDLARRIYYALTVRCKNFCETYGSAEIFSPNIPCDFSVAYRDLALEQLDEHAAEIEREVREMLDGEWAPEMLGIIDPLTEVWEALGL
jgi:uncharacterized Zn finger protein